MPLITEEYRLLNKAMHASPRGFGQSGRKHVPLISRFCQEQCVNSILDYGCGQGTFKTEFNSNPFFLSHNIDIREYDPAIEGKTALPKPADLVICTDVLEHVEPACIESVLNHLWALTRRYGFFVVALTPSHKDLPDGRNAHLLVRSRKWWHTEFKKRWRVVSWEVRGEDPKNPIELSVWVEKLEKHR